MSNEHGIRSMIGKASERQLWRALQNAMASGQELDDATIARLDGPMQGFLFLQDQVNNRKARIAFARSRKNMPYLRDAAGSRNVWMSDAEFGELVEQNDSETLACFVGSEQMDPHQLMYIEYVLAVRPHGRDMLATSYDATIATRKAQERRGHTRGMALMRLAKAALEGSAEIETGLAQRLRRSVVIDTADPRALWRAYLNLKSLDGETLRELMETASGSSGRPSMSSGQGGRSVH